MKQLELVVEKSEDGELWGRVSYQDNLLVDSAATLDKLKEQMNALLEEWHGLRAEDVSWKVLYDLTAFFEQFSFLKISKIADLAGLNPSLVRHYSAGTKNPSLEQVKKIEDVVHRLAKELLEIHLA